MTNQSKNLINVIQQKLQLVSDGLNRFDLYEDRIALEECLTASETLLELVEKKIIELREQEKIKNCKKLAMARRPYSVKNELIPICMAAWSDPSKCCQKKKSKR